MTSATTSGCWKRSITSRSAARQGLRPFVISRNNIFCTLFPVLRRAGGACLWVRQSLLFLEASRGCLTQTREWQISSVSHRWHQEKNRTNKEPDYSFPRPRHIIVIRIPKKFASNFYQFLHDERYGFPKTFIIKNTF